MNQAIPVLVDRLNPLKEVKAAGDIVGGFVHPPKEDGAASSEPDPANRPVPVTPQPPNGLPKNARDPAYAEALKSITYVSGLRIIVDGKDGNIDWEKARGDGSDESTKSTIKFLKVMLETSQKHFQSLADAQGDASNTLRKALDKLVEVRPLMWLSRNLANAGNRLRLRSTRLLTARKTSARHHLHGILMRSKSGGRTHWRNTRKSMSSLRRRDPHQGLQQAA